MKLLVVLLAFATLGNTAPSPRTLWDSFQYFLDLFQWDKISDVIDRHLQINAEFVELVTYLQSQEWKNLTRRLTALPGVEDFSDYLNNAGIPVGEIFRAFEEGIMKARFGTDFDPHQSFYRFLGDIEDVFPFEGMYWFVNRRLLEDADLQRFYVKLAGEDAKEMLDEVLSDAEVKRVERWLMGFGFHVDLFFKCVYERNGWGLPPDTTGTTRRKRSASLHPCTFAFFIFG